jgi:hypothetical protein
LATSHGVRATLGFMTKGGRPVWVSRWRASRARTALAVACPLVAFLSACSSCGSDSPARPSEALRGYRVGSLVQADALGNTVIGGPDRTALAFRFRARWTGSVVAVRVYVIKNVNGRTGYSKGDGGVMRVSLQPDSGRRPHVPVRRRLAAATVRPADEGFFPLVRFDKPARVVAGRRYHVVFANVDAEPDRNYVSINALYSASRLGRGPSVPSGLAVLEGDPAPGGRIRWTPRRSQPREYYLPIVGIVGGRPGQRDGLGYMEVWDPKPIGGEAMVRQVLRTPGGSALRVDSVWLRVRRRAGARAPLVLRLERPDGQALASVSLARKKVPRRHAGWVRARFAKPVSLAAGSRLALTASAATASSYEAFPIRKGTGFGFDRRTFFSAGHAEFNDGGGWVGWDQWGGHDRRDSDLQFALGVAR